MCCSVSHSNSPNIITPALFIKALSSEREKMHSHFGQTYRTTLVIHLKFYGMDSTNKKLNGKYIANNWFGENIHCHKQPGLYQKMTDTVEI